MKIVALPKQMAYPEPDYRNYDSAAESAREAKHVEDLKSWIRENGWAGERTGEILREPHADGYANYMYADGSKPVLVHLPYGDGWNSPNVAHLPKKEVLARLDRQKALTKLFSRAA